MKKSLKYTSMFLTALILFAFSGLRPGGVYGVGEDCSNGIAQPAFLGTSIDPNLLLLIDNSASMYDLAYVNDAKYCFDDTYDINKSYAGYFEEETWYYYDNQTTDEQFEPKMEAEKTSILDAASGTEYSNNDVYIKVNSGAVTTVTAFLAKGNFLNWAAASKIDIEKKILTGGKFETTGTYGALNDRLVMESRGCLNRPLIKQVAVTNGGTTYYLTLGVRPPQEETFPAWESGTVYAENAIVNDMAELYYANAVTGNPSTGTGVDDDTSVTWEAYTRTRWTNEATYQANDIVSDNGKMYITADGGTACGSCSSAATDTSMTWELYNVTHIEIFDVSTSGFAHGDCELAVEEMQKESPNQGQLGTYIDGCLGYEGGGGLSKEADSNGAFNHSLHNCWYMAKQNTWPPGAGPTESINSDCERIYENWGTDPWDITPEDMGYVCYGVWNADPTKMDGYVGRCWKPGGTPSWECIKWKKDETCQKYGWVGGGPGDWDAAGYASVNACIEQALQDYCDTVEIPEVVDPSDQAGETGEFWNLPAVLVDSGVTAQQGEPIAVFKGHIKKDGGAPTGLIQEFAEDLRMGAMAFNYDGSDSECDPPFEPHILYACGDPANRDGGEIISYIDQDPEGVTTHTDGLVSAINAIKATSWTPIAEAMYNAIGYYTQDGGLRLHDNDFLMDEDHDPPICDWCQFNNVLIITDGASTADQHASVAALAAGQDAATDTVPDCGCGALSGSTYLDDMTYYAQGIYPLAVGNNRNIATHIVVAGTLRTTESGDECSPDILLNDAAENGGASLHTAEDPAALEVELREVFHEIRAGASSASAATVISASRWGEGAIYQAVFYSAIDILGEDPVEWAGEVHALLIDSSGEMHEDTNQNRTLDSEDDRVILYYDESDGLTKACYGEIDPDDGTCDGEVKSIDQVKYLWSATESLAKIDDEVIDENRSSITNPNDPNYISNLEKRFIFTWNDLNNDGIVNTTEMLDFVDTTNWATLDVSAGAPRGPVPLDFGIDYLSDGATPDADIDKIVNWLRGLDQENMRSRQLEVDYSETPITMRLGDVIHSTPMAAARPPGGYHLIYGDMTYVAFVERYKDRRHVIYFGGNDGMLHAINGGFYDADNKRFCLTSDLIEPPVGSAPELGAELWAYVPYNLLPHLKCLPDPNYQHKYYVDQRPRIFDVQIFATDADHPNGWGTILVGAMRFGGAKVLPGALDLDGNGEADYSDDKREFTSAYFILDITNPEEPPELLAEFTRTTVAADNWVDLGFTTALPAVVPMKDGATTEWYLLLGSGPVHTDDKARALEGESNQNGRMAVIPLNSLVGASRKAFRIPDETPTDPDETGCWTLPEPNSFVSFPVVIDFDLEENYKADVVYFGTVSGDWENGWSGSVERLKIRAEVDGVQQMVRPSGWELKPLIDTDQPITAAPAVGTDGDNYWVYFGTGRFLHVKDKTDPQQHTYYGIKEPRNSAGDFTWLPVEKKDVTPDTHCSAAPGSQGLLRVDQILVQEAGCADLAALSCINDLTASCLPKKPPAYVESISNFAELVDYIVCEDCSEADSTGTDGWYLNFYDERERNLGQAALLGGIVTFTTYQPFDDDCLSEGLGYIYAVYYQTGTAWYESVYGDDGTDEFGNVITRKAIGRGLVGSPNLHVGTGEGTKAFVQTSTGAIVEIPEPNLPYKNIKTGKVSWEEVIRNTAGETAEPEE